MIVSVLITERPDTDALHAALDTLGRNLVRWPRELPGYLSCDFSGDVDPAAVRALVLSTGVTPTEGADAKRSRLVIDGLSKADLIAAMLDPAALADLRGRLAGQ